MADKTALVVGASRGLGLGLARELAARGWAVIATRRGPAADLETLAAQSGGRVRLETLDLEDEGARQALPGRLAGETLDLVFVNAGISGPRGAVGKASAEAVAQVFVTNAVAPVQIAEALTPQVREKTGVIAFMSSGLGSVGLNRNAGGPLYAASKAALNRLARSYTDEVAAGRGLTVLVMSPGWVRTDMGGPGAMLSVEESVHGLVDVIEAKSGTGEHGFLGHKGEAVPW